MAEVGERLEAAAGWPDERYLEAWAELRAGGWAELADADAAPARRQLRGRFEAVGREPVPLPLFELAVAVPALRAAVGADGDLGDGLAILALPPGAGAPEVDPWQLEGRDGRAFGAVELVPFGWLAESFVVLLGGADGPAVGLVAADSDGVVSERQRSFDVCAGPTRVSLDGAAVKTVLDGSAAQEWWRRLVDLGRLCTACELAGALAALGEQATEYARGRQQFGRPIGSFQAVQHMLADIWTQSLATEAVCAAAADASEEEAARAALAAKAYTAEVALPTAETALQVHGAIGYTRERPLHFYLKRILALTGRFGDAFELQRAVGEAALRGRVTSA